MNAIITDMQPIDNIKNALYADLHYLANNLNIVPTNVK